MCDHILCNAVCIVYDVVLVSYQVDVYAFALIQKALFLYQFG